MGFSADQSMVLFSKANMDALEGRRADINLEKMTLMREQETAALAYSEATSNTCFVFKNDKGEYEAIEPAFDANRNASFTHDEGCPVSENNFDFTKLTPEEQDNIDLSKGGLDAPLKLAQYIGTGKLPVKVPDGNGGFKQGTMAELPGVVESYFTADDAAAKSQYDAIMAKVRTKETKLDMDLEQVETEYQATKTQYDSARQLVNQRAQGDFKMLQG